MKTTIKLRTGASARFVQAVGEGPLPTVLIVHGWKSREPLRPESSYATLQDALAAEGINSLLLCLRGHLGAEGNIATVTRTDHLEDISEAFGWLHDQPSVHPRRLGAYGTSYGSYLLAASVMNSMLRLMAFRVPALYPDNVLLEPSQTVIDWPGLREWREAVHVDRECLALAGMSNFKGKLAMFLSEHDEYMPPSIAESYLIAASSATEAKSEVIPGTKHVLTDAQNAQFQAKLVKWFSDNFKAQSRP